MKTVNRQLLTVNAALAALFLTGCCNFGGVRTPADLPPADGAYIEFVSQTNDASELEDRLWEVVVRLHERSSYACVIQVIELDSGSRIVEAFRTVEGIHELCRIDRHSSSGWGSRTMTVYPGDVVGANWRGDFAMLEADENGSRTRVHSGFNAEHQASHGIHGRVVNADRSMGFEWSIDAREDGLTVTIPPERLVPRPDDEETISLYERTDR